MKIILSLFILLLLDAVYLTSTQKIMTDQIVHVQKFSPKLRIPSAILCYVFLFLGLYYFILKPHRSIWDAFILGLVIYGVYETTNYAIFKNWTLSTVIIDTLWGGTLLALTTAIFYKL